MQTLFLALWNSARKTLRRSWLTSSKSSALDWKMSLMRNFWRRSQKLDTVASQSVKQSQSAQSSASSWLSPWLATMRATRPSWKRSKEAPSKYVPPSTSHQLRAWHRLRRLLKLAHVIWVLSVTRTRPLFTWETRLIVSSWTSKKEGMNRIT